VMPRRFRRMGLSGATYSQIARFNHQTTRHQSEQRRQYCGSERNQG
jgi:hypothetical protein